MLHVGQASAARALPFLLEGQPPEGTGTGTLSCPLLRGVMGEGEGQRSNIRLGVLVHQQAQDAHISSGCLLSPWDTQGCIRDGFFFIPLLLLPSKNQEVTAAGPALTVFGKCSRPVSSRDTCQ